MKKFALILPLILVSPILFISGCTESKESQLSRYSLNLEFNDEEMTLEGTQTVCYVNSSNNAFSSLPFFLYANAFSNEVKNKPVSAAAMDRAYPHGESFGGIEISDVKVSGQAADFSITGQDCNFLEVQFNDTLYPDETIEISMSYKISLANINHRLGYGDSTINLGNFYPIACVYEDGKGFVKNEFAANGDPFYSEVANYEVSINYPEKYTLATTGEAETNVQSGEKVSKIKASKTRDFCMVLSEKFKVLQDKTGKVDVKYYYYNDAEPQLSLKASKDALQTYSELFGVYPYAQLSVVQSNFVFGGMEYPQLVMISDAVETKEDNFYVIAHEIAHQWWYGVVGNNEFQNAWQDESLTEYSTALFFEKNEEYGLKYSDIVKSAVNSYKGFLDIFGKIYDSVDKSMIRALNEYKTEPEYVNCIYVKGVVMYDSIREGIGERKFLKSLQKYYKNYAYKNPLPEELINIFEDVAGTEMEGIFNMWLLGNEIIM